MLPPQIIIYYEIIQMIQFLALKIASVSWRLGVENATQLQKKC